MRDEANNSVMGLLFLSGDWWDGSGGARAEEGAAGWKGRPGCCYGTHPSFRCSGAKQAEQAVSPPCVLEGRSATTPQQHAVCPSRLGHTLWPPRSQNISSRQLCAADIHRCLASSFVPSVKFPATSMGFHVQNTCDRSPYTHIITFLSQSSKSTLQDMLMNTSLRIPAFGL